MPWPSSAVNSGPRRLSPPPRITETYRNSQPTCSTAFCSSPADRPDLQSQAKDTSIPAYCSMVIPHDAWRRRKPALLVNTITHMGGFGSTVLDQIIIRDFPWVV